MKHIYEYLISAANVVYSQKLMLENRTPIQPSFLSFNDFFRELKTYKEVILKKYPELLPTGLKLLLFSDETVLSSLKIYNTTDEPVNVNFDIYPDDSEKDAKICVKGNDIKFDEIKSYISEETRDQFLFKLINHCIFNNNIDIEVDDKSLDLKGNIEIVNKIILLYTVILDKSEDSSRETKEFSNSIINIYKTLKDSDKVYLMINKSIDGIDGTNLLFSSKGLGFIPLRGYSPIYTEALITYDSPIINLNHKLREQIICDLIYLYINGIITTDKFLYDEQVNIMYNANLGLVYNQKVLIKSEYNEVVKQYIENGTPDVRKKILQDFREFLSEKHNEILKTSLRELTIKICKSDLFKQYFKEKVVPRYRLDNSFINDINQTFNDEIVKSHLIGIKKDIDELIKLAD